MLTDELIDYHLGRCLWLDMVLIILYDQVPRNIYRNKPEFYLFDKKALPIARFYSKKINELPFHMVCTVIICLSHSENIRDHNIVSDLIKNISYNEYQVFASLKKIFKNHSFRVYNFGRIPERNKILNRTNTIMEKAFLESL